MAARPSEEDYEDYVPPAPMASPDGDDADALLEAALEAQLPVDPLLRKMRRAAIRKQRVLAIEESEHSSDVAKGRKRKGSRSRSRRRRNKKGTDSDEEEMRENARMMALLRPVGMVHQGIGRGALDVVTGGYGGIAPIPNAPELGGIMGLAQSMNPVRDGQKVCMKFLMNICLNGDSCDMKHPSNPFDVNRWIQYFNKCDCKYGDACPADRCIYAHPNRPGYGGGPMILQGTSL